MKFKKVSFKNLLDIFYRIFICVFIVIIAVLAYSRVTDKKVLKYSPLWVLSGSMETTFPAKSYILIKSADAKDVKVGDVITFYSRDPALNGALNTHRVVEILENGTKFRTKGDNKATNPEPDEYLVNDKDIVGKYVCNLPVLTVLGRFFATKAGFIITVAVILLLSAGWFFLVYGKKPQEKTVSETKEEMIERLIKEEVRRLEEGNKND